MDKYSCRDAIEQIALYIDPVESALGSLLADAKEGVGQYSPTVLEHAAAELRRILADKAMKEWKKK